MDLFKKIRAKVNNILGTDSKIPKKTGADIFEFDKFKELGRDALGVKGYNYKADLIGKIDLNKKYIRPAQTEGTSGVNQGVNHDVDVAKSVVEPVETPTSQPKEVEVQPTDAKPVETPSPQPTVDIPDVPKIKINTNSRVSANFPIRKFDFLSQLYKEYRPNNDPPIGLEHTLTMVGYMVGNDDYTMPVENRKTIIKELASKSEDKNFEEMPDNELLGVFVDDLKSELEKNPVSKLIFDTDTIVNARLSKYYTHKEYIEHNKKFREYYRDFNENEIQFMHDYIINRNSGYLAYWSDLKDRNIEDIVTNQLGITDPEQRYDYMQELFDIYDDTRFIQRIDNLNARPFLVENAKDIEVECMNDMLNADTDEYNQMVEDIKPYLGKGYKMRDVINIVAAKRYYESTHDKEFDIKPLTREELNAKKRAIVDKLYPEYKHNYRPENDCDLTYRNIAFAEKLAEKCSADNYFAKSIIEDSAHIPLADVQVKMDWYDRLSDLIGQKKISPENSLKILDAVNQCNEVYLQKLLDADGLYPLNEIGDRLIKGAGENDKEFMASKIRVLELLKQKNEENPIKPNKARMIIDCTDERTEELITRMINDGKIPIEDIAQSMENGKDYIDSKVRVYDKLSQKEDVAVEDFVELMQYTKSADSADLIVELSDYEGMELNDIWEISYGIGSPKNDFKEKKEILKLIKEKKLDAKTAASILKPTGKDTFLLAQTLLWNEDFPKDRIGTLLESKHAPYRYEMYGELSQDKHLSQDTLADVLEAACGSNLNLIEKAYYDKRFPNELIKNITDKKEVGQTIKMEMFDHLIKDKSLPKETMADIVGATTRVNSELVREIYQDNILPKDRIALAVNNIYDTRDLAAKKGLYDTFKNDDTVSKDVLAQVMASVNVHNGGKAKYLCKNFERLEVQPEDIPVLLQDDSVSAHELNKLRHVIGKEKYSTISDTDKIIGAQLVGLAGKTDINEISIEDKKDVLKQLIDCNTGMFNVSEMMAEAFPLIPRNQEQYCELLPAIVKSMGIDITPLKPDQRIDDFNNSMHGLSDALAGISDEDFAGLNITQEFSKDDFIRTVHSKVKDLPRNERQKVYDYFGFELHHRGKYRGETQDASKKFTIVGYPANLNNGKKMAKITHPQTKAVVEDLRADVIRFSENNPIHCENPAVEKLLNEVISVLPEMRTMIGKAQHGNGTDHGHDFDLMKHSLKVMQKITQDPKFKELNESDQKVMLLASLLHDITKAEGHSDRTHAKESSFDSFFIGKKFNLTKDEEQKLYTLCKHHEWLGYANTAKDKEELQNRLQSVAYDLRQDNIFDMAEIFTHADLRAVKVDDSFHDRTDGESRLTLDGTQRSFGESANVYAEQIREMIGELKKSQPILPTARIPNAGTIKQALVVNEDGSTNIKGIYVNKDGLVIIKYNEVEDWESIGFDKGSISHGISAKGLNNRGQESEVDTGNIKFIAHGLDYANQLAKFDAFGLVDSNALLSVSYMERPESKYRLFRTQGVLLDVDTKNIHGGGNTDSGSGCKKSIKDFKDDYVFGGCREEDRLYLSNLVKRATGMTDEEYIKFVAENENKPFSEIEPAEIRDAIIKEYATINSNVRKGNREYNEMYASNPRGVAGVFTYSADNYVGNPIEFLETHNKHKKFLQKYAIEHNIPMVVFGD